ncbi:hypothetical protein F511_21141 [Dorcoceras hygrometricum]|uniref:Uncharacterized protein n=1 Tax=Dorcoceras hygrometricum TaxID=472368 RepID=A0A2Z7CM25_9LAMI|nr:hypothetical protein F511_21141 [Dorcoceras hygrometricum]
MDDLLESVKRSQASTESRKATHMHENYQQMSTGVATLSSQVAEVFACLRDRIDAKKGEVAKPEDFSVTKRRFNQIEELLLADMTGSCAISSSCWFRLSAVDRYGDVFYATSFVGGVILAAVIWLRIGFLGTLVVVIVHRIKVRIWSLYDSEVMAWINCDIAILWNCRVLVVSCSLSCTWLRPVSRGNRHFTIGGGRLRQSGPRPEGRLLRQPALEGLTRSTRTETPRKVGRNKFRREAAAAAQGGGDDLREEGGGAFRARYGPFNPYIPIRSTTIGKSRVVIDPIAMHTSWRSNSDIASVTSIGYPRMSASGESSTTMHRLLHTSGSHPIPPPNDPKSNQYNQDLGLIHSTNGNHMVILNEGSSIDHQVTIYLHAQNITMFPTNETCACKNQLVVVSVQYGPLNPYIPIRSTTIGKSRVAIDPIAMHTSWRSNSDIASVTRLTSFLGAGESAPEQMGGGV